MGPELRNTRGGTQANRSGDMEGRERCVSAADAAERGEAEEPADRDANDEDEDEDDDDEEEEEEVEEDVLEEREDGE